MKENPLSELYAVAREVNAHRAFAGKYWNKNPKGTYYCSVILKPDGNSLANK